MYLTGIPVASRRINTAIRLTALVSRPESVGYWMSASTTVVSTEPLEAEMTALDGETEERHVEIVDDVGPEPAGELCGSCTHPAHGLRGRSCTTSARMASSWSPCARRTPAGHRHRPHPRREHQNPSSNPIPGSSSASGFVGRTGKLSGTRPARLVSGSRCIDVLRTRSRVAFNSGGLRRGRAGRAHACHRRPDPLTVRQRSAHSAVASTPRRCGTMSLATPIRLSAIP